MKYIIIILSLLLVTPLLSQVGINNTNPNATLEINASNVGTPSNEDGILIPRVDNFPLTSPTSLQDGMMIFITGDGTPAKGFYYWDDDAGSWISVNGDKNTLDEGYDEGGVGAGRIITADNGALEIQDTGGLRVEGDIAAAANIIHDGDTNTFITFTPDRLQIDAGGRNYIDIQHANTEITFNEDSTQSDFRVESGTEQYMLFVDGINDAVGIGQNNPVSPLQIGMETNFDLAAVNSGQDGLFLIGSDNTGLNSYGASIGFGGPTTTRKNSRRAAISTVQTGTSAGTDVDFIGLAFHVHRSAINISDMIEAMRINHQGYLGINNTAPDATLDVVGTMQFVDGNEAAGYVLASDATGNATWTDPSGIITDTDTQNTLDAAYDEGGAGAGSIITADSGAVTINGDDGFSVSGTFGSGDVVNLTGAGTRMFFNPRKAAFRAGNVTGTQWNDANIGNYSSAFGNNTSASGIYTTAMGFSTTASGDAATAMGRGTDASGDFTTAIGYYTTASGDYATAMGYNTTASGFYTTSTGYNTTASGNYATALGYGTIASGNRSTAAGFNATASGYYTTAIGFEITSPSAFETTLGSYNTTYTPASTINWNTSDRLFSIGNGTSNVARSNALTIYKNGTMNINDAYNMPTADGTAGQVLTTDGSGNVSFSTPSTGGVTLDEAYDFGGPGVGRTINAENGAVTINRNSSFAGSALDISLTSTYTLSERSAISTSNAMSRLETYTNINRTSGPPWGQGLLIKNIPSETINGKDGIAIEFTQTSTLNYLNDNRGFLYDVTYEGGSAASLYGYQANIEGSGTAGKYGAHITIPSTSGGNHYGIYSDVQSSSGYAGYFIGRTSLGDGTTNRYTMPSADGSSGQVMQTNGAGTVSWASLSGESTTASNGLSETGNDVRLGGSLIQSTTINLGNFPMNFNLNSVGDFVVQVNGTNEFEVQDSGTSYFGGNSFWKQNNTSGTNVARVHNIGTEGYFDLYNGGSVTTRFRANGSSYFNGGRLGIGIPNPFYQLDVVDDTSSYVSWFDNSNTGTAADGIAVVLGAATTGTGNRYIAFLANGGSSLEGRISGDGTGGVIYNTTSDRRLKTNFKKVEGALDLVMKTKPTIYEFKKALGKKEMGFIAQELQKVYPQAVSGNPNGDVTEDPMMVDYGRLTPLLAASIQELNTKIETLSEENQRLKEQLSKYESFEARLSALENKNLENKPLTDIISEK